MSRCFNGKNWQEWNSNRTVVCSWLGGVFLLLPYFGIIQLVFHFGGWTGNSKLFTADVLEPGLQYPPVDQVLQQQTSCFRGSSFGAFPSHWGSPNHPILDLFSIETYGFCMVLRIPFKKPPISSDYASGLSGRIMRC